MADPVLRSTWDGLHIAADSPTGATVVVRRRGLTGQPELLLLRRAHNGPDFAGDWAWTSPAGCRQPGEAVYAAALRELAEEAGIVNAKPWAVDLSWRKPSQTQWVIFAVDVARDVRIDLVDPEHDRYEWLSPKEARQRVLPAFVAAAQVDALQRIPMVNLAFRPLTLEDLPLVVDWRRETHVAKWWHGGPATQEDAERRYGPRIRGDDPTRMWVVGVDGRDVGYLQAYRVGDYKDYAVATGEPDAVAFDYLIGDPELIGKGIGTRMIWEFLRDVLAPGCPDAPRFLASPDPRNAASLRTLAKCGFTRGPEIVLPADEDSKGEPVIEVLCTLDRDHWFGRPQAPRLTGAALS